MKEIPYNVEHYEMDDFYIPVCWEVHYYGSKGRTLFYSGDIPERANSKYEECTKKYPRSIVVLEMLTKIRYRHL